MGILSLLLMALTAEQVTIEVHFYGKAITVCSESGVPQQCVIEYPSEFVFDQNEGQETIISHITIFRVSCYGSSPTIIGCEIMWFEINSDASPTLMQCNVYNLECRNSSPSFIDLTISGTFLKFSNNSTVNISGLLSMGVTVDIRDSSAEITSATIENAENGISAQDSFLFLSNIEVSNCEDYGISISGTAEIDNCTVSNCNPGAIIYGTVSITESSFYENSLLYNEGGGRYQDIWFS